MPYAALTFRKMALSVDGTVVGWNNTTAGAGLVNVLSAGDMQQIDGESPAKVASTAMGAGSTSFIYVIFPELRDLTGWLIRGSASTPALSQMATSPDTTNGADGTWTAITVAGGGSSGANTTGTDWWRASAPAALTGSVTGIKGIRIQVNPSGGSGFIQGLHIFGKKTTGQTADDVIFLDLGLVSEITADYDYGDVPAASANRDVTLAVKNVAPAHTANNIVLDFVGSNPGDYNVSIDGGSSFGTTKTITSLVAAASQPIVVRFIPPAASAGNYTPRAAQIRAVVTSWT